MWGKSAIENKEVSPNNKLNSIVKNKKIGGMSLHKLANSKMRSINALKNFRKGLSAKKDADKTDIEELEVNPII